MADRILIVEDDVSIAELIRDYLEINGMQAEIALTGKTGLKRVDENVYDLILLDLMLPETDGFEVLKRIRETKDTPVLLVSAKREDIDKIRGFGLGADDYITKPFSPGELVARVKAHLARFRRLTGKTVSRSGIINIRGMEIDTDARTVSIGGKAAELTSKEYDILLFMARNPNKVFSKDQLFDRIWGMEAYGDTTTVTVHIGNIRDKIETDPKNPQYIETVWGAGYRFKV
ncbi:MAG TPA: response regulator transcription factor [Clostridia bacterium]|nr:response regulator transcription factor [Clostridia bacterium]